MASSSSSSSSFPYVLSHVTIFIAISIIMLFVSPTSSTSRHVLDHHHQNLQKGFKVDLIHVDSGGNFTRFERLQRAMKRGRHRLQKLTFMALARSENDDSNSEITSPIHAGNGEFLMKLSIGTPRETYSAIMDTGSDLIWTQCKPCKQCFDQPTPVFDPKKSSSFSKVSCSNKHCEALPISSCGNSCEYSYSYGDSSSTRGVLATETFTFGEVSVPKIAFGCGLNNQGDGFTQGAGLVGLGRGPLSLVSQLDQQKFSYCLTSMEESEKTSTLIMGSLATINLTGNNDEIRTTPLIKNPMSPTFYYLSLEGITVGGTRLSIKKSTFKLNEDGSGGMIIDSGTTITYLEEDAFDLVKKEFTSQMKLPVDDSGSTGLDLCFTLPSNANNVEVPKLIFHFNGADLDLPGENYIVADSSMGLACLAMGSSNGMSIFGNVQQQNMLVLHDLEKERLSFLPTKCDEL